MNTGQLNTAGHAICGRDARLDANCKNLLSCKGIAAFVMKSTIKEYENLSLDEISALIIGEPEVSERLVDDVPEQIQTKNSESSSANDGLIRYDVVFNARLPGENDAAKIIIDIEAQNAFKPKYNLLTRATYYLGRLLSEQKETIFHNSDYNLIRKVYSIWLCINPNEEARNVINRYELHEECVFGDYQFPKETYDKMCIVMACLGAKDSENNLVRLFSSIFDEKMPTTEKLQMAQKCGITITKEIKGGIETMCNYSDYVYDQGEAKGKVKTLLRSIRSMMNGLGVSFDKAAEVLDLSKEELVLIQEYSDELKKEGNEKNTQEISIPAEKIIHK